MSDHDGPDQTELLDKRREIIGVQVNRDVGHAVCTNRIRKMISPAIGDGSVFLREELDMEIPNPIVGKPTVDEDHRAALPLFYIGQFRVVDGDVSHVAGVCLEDEHEATHRDTQY